MKHILSSGRTEKLVVRQVKSPAIVKVFLLFCLFAAYLFSSTVYAQSTDKAKRAEQREQLMTQLEASMVSFLTTVRSKREQNHKQLEDSRLELDKHLAKKKSKKDQAIDAQIEQVLRRRVTVLENKEKDYDRMEDEAIETLVVLDSQLPLDVPRSSFMMSTITQYKEKKKSQLLASAGEGQNQEQQKNITDLDAQVKMLSASSGQQKEELQAQLEANAASYLASVQTKREQNQQQLKSLENELKELQSKKKSRKTQAMDEQNKQALQAKIANLEKKDLEYQQMEEEAIASLLLIQNQLAAMNEKTSQQSSTTKSSQTQNTRSSSNQSTTTTQSPRVSYGYQPANKNVTDGYYIVFGSFIERGNAERFISKLRTQFSNVVDIGNDNTFGMYRTGIGPYKTKEEAIAHRPTDMKNWILRVETIPNTRMVKIFEYED